MGWESLKRKRVSTTFPTRLEDPQRPSKKRLYAVSCGYLCLTLILTFPLIARINTHMCGDQGENYAFVCCFWWFNKALTDLHTNPFYTHYLHHPHGTSLLLTETSLSNTLLSIPLQKALPLITVYNLLVLCSFWIASVGMYLLVFHLTGSPVSSFVAGFVYAFCSFHFAHALGHLTTLSIEWIPFFLLYVVKSLQEARGKNIFLASLFFTLNALSSWYFLVYCGMFLGWVIIYFGFPWNRKESVDVIKKGASILGLTLLVLAPVLMPMIAEKIRGHYLSGHPPSQYPADLAGFFIPNVTSTYSMFFYPIWSSFKANAIESSTFVGCSVLALFVYSLLKTPYQVRVFWVWATGIFFILSLGPYLNVFGKSLGIPLPYLLFHHLVPFASFTGVPARFHVMTTACLAVLIGYGTKGLTEDLRQALRSKRKRLSYLAGTVLLVALLISDHLHVPMIMTRVNVSPFYVRMGKDPQQYAIIDLTAPGKALFCLSIHQKNLVGGYLARNSQRNDSFLRDTDIIRDILSASSSVPADGRYPDPAYAREILGKYHVRYVIYPRECDPLRFERALCSYLGLRLQALPNREPGSRSSAQEGKMIEREAGGLIENVVQQRGWRQSIPLLFKVRFLLASRPEIFPYGANIPSTAASEHLVAKVWRFPLVYEDDEIRVYSTSG